MSAMYEQPMIGTDAEVARTVTVTGTIPAALDGTILRNGPGVLKYGEHAVNWFDGNGYIAGLTLRDGAAFLRTRNVPTPGLAANRAGGGQQKRMLFTNHPSRWRNFAALDLENPDNHDVYAWNGKVIATNDPGHHALDDRTLADRGPERWNGVIPPKHNMCPMPQVEPATGRLIAYTVKPGGTKPDELTFLELDADLNVVQRAPTVKLAGSPVIVHSHTFSERWHMVVELPGKLSALTALWGAKTVYESFSWPADGLCTMVMVERGGAGRSLRVPMPKEAAIIFHLANASDDGDIVTVDGVAYDGPPEFDRVAPAELLHELGKTNASAVGVPRVMRWRIDTRTGTVVDAAPVGEGEAPAFDRRFAGRPTRYVFVCSPCLAGDEPAVSFYGFFHGMSRLDATGGAPVIWNAGPNALCSPPVFVPRSADAPEGDGWMLGWVTDGDTGMTSVVIVDTADVAAGPVARIALDMHLPGVSHTRWAPGVSLRG